MRVGILLGVWLMATGATFALAPSTTSRFVDRLRGQHPAAIPHGQIRQARSIGFCVVLIGALAVVLAAIVGN